MGDWSDGVRENGLEKHENKIKKIRYDQGYQYRTGGHTGLATGTIYTGVPFRFYRYFLCL